MKSLFMATTIGLTVLLCGCGSDGVDVLMQSSADYKPVPLAQVRVSAHPPQGKYEVIALFSLNAEADDTPVLIAQKLQHRASVIGADYVWVTGGVERTYLAPAMANTFSTANAYGTGQATYDGYGNVTGSANVDAYGNSTSFYTPAHTYNRALIEAKALKMISGSREPDTRTATPFGPNAP